MDIQNYLKELQLTKPIISFDLETTGIDTKKDRILSISAIKHFPDGVMEIKKMLINPQIPIPAESTKVHGITDEMVKDAPIFASIAKSMFTWFQGSDTLGFNIFDYDIPILGRQFYECGLQWDYGFVIDVFKIEKKTNAHNLMATYKRHLKKEFSNAHDSEADNVATLEIMEQMLLNNSSIPRSVESISNMFIGEAKNYADFSRNFYWDSQNNLVWNINPKKDTIVNPKDKLCDWFLEKDFSMQSKEILIKYMSKK